MVTRSQEFVSTDVVRKPRLAIVSTFDELCGIAGYTRFLIKQLERHFEIEVFDLDQFFMRSQDRRVRKLADDMIKEFCLKSKQFDFVNIQLEHGTLGHFREDIWRRFSWLAKAAPALSVTFHTILSQEKFDIAGFLNKMARANFSAISQMLVSHKTNVTLTRRMYRLLRSLQAVKPVNVIVHTRRDMRLMRHVNRINSVYDHPLAFLTSSDVQTFHAQANRDNFPLIAKLPRGSKLIGVFGFLSDYKGFETAIRALQNLPKSYHLALFGALHPNEIKARQPINPYLKRLLDEAYVRKTVLDDYGTAKSSNSINLSIDSSNVDLLINHPRDVSRRLHFMGAQTDEDFARAMGVCDIAVFPYLEVGQSSSGPISIALEMGVRVIAARTRAFMQLEKYHPNAFEMFEIGNFIELAQRITADPSVVCGVQKRRFDAITNSEMYIRANSIKGPEIEQLLDSVPTPVEALRAAE